MPRAQAGAFKRVESHAKKLLKGLQRRETQALNMMMPEQREKYHLQMEEP